MPPRRKNEPPKSAIKKDPDVEISRIAARQWGAVRGAQARKTGLTHRQIAYRVQVKRWRRPAQDVFVLAGTRDTWQQRAMVACLAGPPKAVTSHLTAAAVYGLAKPPEQPHVTIPPDASGHRIKGARVRRADLRPANGRSTPVCRVPRRSER